MSMHRGGHPIQRAEPLLCPSPARTTAKAGPAVDVGFDHAPHGTGKTLRRKEALEYDLKSSLPITERAPAQSGPIVGYLSWDWHARSTLICCLSTTISASSVARDRSRSIIVPKISLHKANISSSIARFLDQPPADWIYDRDRLFCRWDTPRATGCESRSRCERCRWQPRSPVVSRLSADRSAPPRLRAARPNQKLHAPTRSAWDRSLAEHDRRCRRRGCRRR
jgi:hypothetical protein